MPGQAVDPLTAGRLRLDRAIGHLEDFERTQQVWLDGLPSREPAVTPSAADPLVWEVRFELPPAMPLPFTLIVSDAIQNIRVALDYAAYWVVQNCGGNPNDSHFPYCWDLSEWPARHRRQLPKVGEPWLGLIKSDQPFTNSRSGLAFGEIARLSNVDKHRFLIPHYAFTRFEDPRPIEDLDATGVEEVRTIGETGYQQTAVLGYRIRMSHPTVRPPFTFPDPVSFKFGQYKNGQPGPGVDQLRFAVDAADKLLSRIAKLS